MNTLTLEIVTPNGSVYQKENVELAVLQTTAGEMGVMHGHIPTVTPLRVGHIKVNFDNDSDFIAVTEGFAEIRRDKVNILVQTAETADEIDVERAKSAKQRATFYLDGDKADTDINRAQRALERANNRIEVAKFK
ncbi:F0F1 ATP synthase subunit epsilon [Staphylococcus massiliensis]|uniref:ATP synthase epsilon chain n=1 Tax=Staphylococcus massiliensis S46 TaxID=1229783 RepID=K9AIJ4_9STAP|nr:F0F1 ATP synthase subunit epsilon [Staphylococcus massiliensis]EKU47158.1 F0F1 ATP synthase subunit epsilon [Staphylococcus massiliensis S46]MCG3400164.1 F0F1 ATP synthase subunit epsilon [Staphylococcus massiliensis]MCG3402731.1 F0F1 ATP synthase subunit epsilon [Staphylococcus massiliensis]MCG3413507.1 F0F1 ATP synthase subunit epsilon [Staphylococcus massiliensis]PNZ99808.1 F0F1 ATP synthase subunit epsilon [Staphylococcus massiliensis CCUG 55927]